MRYRAAILGVLLAASACHRKEGSAPPVSAGARSAPAACPDPHVRVKAKLEALEKEIATKQRLFALIPENPDDEEWVKQKLGHMVDVDQTMRLALMDPTADWNPIEREYFFAAGFIELRGIDSKNTRDLKRLLDRHGWFTINEWGPEADQNAWLLVQHADLDPDFQARILALLEPLHARGETSPSNFAYLYDRVAVANDRPQRYGTQGRCTEDGSLAEPSLEDASRIDELRASVGLESLAEYRKKLGETCL